QRRLLVDPGQGAGGSPRRGVRRADAWKSAPRALGGCGGRGAEQCRPDRREVSRQPAGARLSGAARPHREECAASPTPRRARERGVKLTESLAMWPGASVSGLYLAHPQSHYFGVGKIERDQIEDYAARKGWTVVEAERWLAPVLNYDPAEHARAPAA